MTRFTTQFRCLLIAPVLLAVLAVPVSGQNEWEVTPESELALERGLAWLAKTQGAQGNWESNDLGLVGLGALAFLSAGHMPGRGKYGDNVDRALKFVVKNAKPSGLLNIADAQRDLYNHGLAAFVLGQAYGMTDDPQIGKTLERALKLIANTQCDDGSWDYRAKRQTHGHDLSLSVMQAKALRSAVDSGFEATIAMAACGVVCLQEFGQYDDWRIPKNLDYMAKEMSRLSPVKGNGEVPFDAYTLYYVGQAIYQAGGPSWRTNYPILRDHLVASQVRKPENPAEDGSWRDTRWVHGKQGQLYGTAVGCFILAIPNRFLPILQEGKIEGLREKLGGEKPN